LQISNDSVKTNLSYRMTEIVDVQTDGLTVITIGDH